MKFHFVINRKKIIINTIILLLIYYAYTADSLVLSSVYNNAIILITFVIIGAYLLIIKGNIGLSKIQASWLLLDCVILTNTIVFNGVRESITNLYLVWILACFFIIPLSNDYQWQKIAFNMILLITIFHALAGWYYYFNQEQYLTSILSTAVEPWKSGLKFEVSKGVIVGFANHYSVIGMYISIGFIASFTRAIVVKKKKWILITLGMLISLFMTEKRGVTLFSILTILIVYIILGWHSIKDIIRAHIKLLLSIIAGVLILIVLGNTVLPTIFGMFVRTIKLSSAGDVSAGRFVLWSTAFSAFLENPIWGIGWSNFTTYTRLNETCSSYLEFLSCTGIVGFLCFLTAAGSTFRITFGKFRKTFNNPENYSLDSKLLIVFSFSIQLFFWLYSITAEAIIVPPMYIPFFLACAMGIAFET